MDRTHLAGKVIEMNGTTWLRPAPARLVLLCTAGWVALFNLWSVVGRPVENRTGSLLLGLAAAGGTLDGLILATALLGGGIHRASRLMRQRP